MLLVISVLLSTIIVILLFLNVYMKSLCSDFDEAGIRYVKPYPIFGNFLFVILRREHILHALKNICKQFPDDKYIGFFNFMVPMIIVKDPDLIKDITIKSFQSFQDHTIHLSENVEPLFGRILPNLKGQKWRDMRANLTPAFTSSKIRNMYGFISQCSGYMTSYYNEICKENLEINGEASVETEARDLVTRFTNDVIASTAFGFKVDSFRERDNRFYKMGESMSYVNIPKFLGLSTYPNIMKFFKIRLMPKESTDFFKKLLTNVTEEREASTIYRPDMLQLLMEARKDWSDDDFAAQAMLFFLAGFEGATLSYNFFLYTLLSRPDIQDKIYKEILTTRRLNNDVITYEVIQSMKYLDMVISETFRRWPSGLPYTGRRCLNDHIFPPARLGLSEYKVRKGCGIWIIPNYTHLDPKYWSDPERFDPERFSDENISKIVQCSYIPFGTGPRKCIGKRFALIELKIFTFHLVNNFQMMKCDRTPLTIELDRKTLNMKFRGDLWIKLKARCENFD